MFYTSAGDSQEAADLIDVGGQATSFADVAFGDAMGKYKHLALKDRTPDLQRQANNDYWQSQGVSGPPSTAAGGRLGAAANPNSLAQATNVGYSTGKKFRDSALGDIGQSSLTNYLEGPHTDIKKTMNINANAMIQKAQADNSVDWMGAAGNIGGGLWEGYQDRLRQNRTKELMGIDYQRQIALAQYSAGLKTP
jgi:hypothetical protein